MRRLFSWLLLMSLVVNTLHAFVVDAAEECAHETVTKYLQESDHDSDCGDLCDVHRFFHIPAIPVNTTPVVVALPKTPVPSNTIPTNTHLPF